MDQFNKNTYKRRNSFQEFYHSCFGQIIIIVVLAFIAFIVALFTRPTDEVVVTETEDNIRQCLQDNDSTKCDVIDEIISNVSRTFTEADTTFDDKEVLEDCWRFNKLETYRHSFYTTARVRNNTHPEGVRVGIGIFGTVISTVYYTDLVLNTGPVRGKYNQRLIQDVVVPDEYIGDNPNLKPYHYKGNPDD